MVNVDLHCHTFMSDGVSSPSDLCEYADKNDTILAITDHDRIYNHGGSCRNIITGGEFNSTYIQKDKSCVVHLLAYFPRSDMNCLNMSYDRQLLRKAVMQANIILINETGLLPREIFFDEISVPHDFYSNIWIAKHIHGTMGLFAGEQEVWDKLILPSSGIGIDYDGSPFNTWAQDVLRKRNKNLRDYIFSFGLSVANTVKLIKEHNGISVLAHPGKLPQWCDACEIIMEAGIQGIEVYYPYGSGSDIIISMCKNLADRYDLIITAGSDSHENIPGPWKTDEAAGIEKTIEFFYSKGFL